MPSVRNIIVGAASVFVSTATKTDGTAAAGYPSLNTNVSASVTQAADTANWRDVGYTSDGVEMTYEPEFGEIKVDQLLDAARLFKQSQKVMLKTAFAEATLENLFLTMNQTSGLSGTSIGSGGTGTAAQTLEFQGGTLGDYPVERSMVFVGPGPRPTSGNSERVYYASRVMSIESSSHGLKREEGTFFPVTFRLLPVASTSNAYGKIVDRTLA